MTSSPFSSDISLSFPEVGRLLGFDRRRVWEDRRVREAATLLPPAQGTPSGRYSITLAALNKALGLRIAPAAALAVKAKPPKVPEAEEW
jgi:hypothetical protein